MRRVFGFLLGLVFLISCSNAGDEIVIIQVNDVYEIGALNKGKVGGMSRVATIYNQEKQNNPNTLLILAGDFLSPSLLGSLKQGGEPIAGAQMVDIMNRMHMDLVVLGNHEFDIKRDQLQKRMDESDFDWLNTNVYYKDEKGALNEMMKNGVPLPKSKIYEFDNGYKLGFVGATIDSKSKSYLHYADYYDSAEEEIDAMEPKVDLIVGLTHLSIDQDKVFAKRFPQIPLIMGGHEHENMNVQVGKSRITKADANAKSLYLHRINTATNEIESELILLDESVAQDKVIEKRVAYWMSIQNAELSDIIEDPQEIVYYAESPLEGTEQDVRSRQTNLGKLISESMLDYYEDIDAAMVNSGSIRIDDNLDGAITASDIFRVLPFGGEICKVQIRGSLLESVLTFSDSKKGSGAYFQLANIERKDSKWYIEETPIQQDELYWVSTSKFMLSGYDIPFFTEDHADIVKVVYPDSDEDAKDIRKVVIEYLEDLEEDS